MLPMTSKSKHLSRPRAPVRCAGPNIAVNGLLANMSADEGSFAIRRGKLHKTELALDYAGTSQNGYFVALRPIWRGLGKAVCISALYG